MRPQNTPTNDPFNDGTHPLSSAPQTQAPMQPPTPMAPKPAASLGNLVGSPGTENATPQDIKAQRVAGLGLTALGLVMSYFTIYRPLDAAAHAVANLSYSMKLTAITPFLLLYGVSLLLFPKFVLTHQGGFGSRTPKTKIGWAYFSALILIGFVVSLWMEAQFRAYGYRF